MDSACRKCSRVDRGHRAPDGGGDLVAEVDVAVDAGHVGHVDAPGVQAVRSHPPGDHRVGAVVEAAAQLGGAVVEDRHVREVPPRGVLVGVPVEEVERRLGAGRVGQRGLEPLVGVAAVVGRQVTHQAHAAGVRRVGEPCERRITAEQRVDPVERRGVVPVVGLRGEQRRQVQGAHPEGGDVVQVRGDPVEVAAEELARTVRALPDHGVVPRCRDRPRRGRPVRGLGEPVREDLVHRAGGPLCRLREGGHPEVERVCHVPAVQPGPVEPLVAVRATVQQEPVGHDGVHDRQVGAQPGVGLVATVQHCRHQLGLAVLEDAHPRIRGITGCGHPQEHGQGPAELGGLLGDVGARPVVVRLRPAG